MMKRPIDDETSYIITCGCGRYVIKSGYDVPRFDTSGMVKVSATVFKFFGAKHRCHTPITVEANSG